MKKILCALMSLILVICTMPMIVMAEEPCIGPHANARLSLYDDEGNDYRYVDPEFPLNTRDGVTYDSATNTMTLNNVDCESLRIEACDMGSDFKIVVNGENTIKYINSYSGNEYNCSVTITGTGTLNIMFVEMGITIGAWHTASKLTIDKTTSVKSWGAIYVDSSTVEHPLIINCENEINESNYDDEGVLYYNAEIYAFSDGEMTEAPIQTIVQHTHTPISKDTPATCAADGQRLVICSECEEVLEEKPIPALPHTLVETLVPSTCATTGMRSVICSECGEVLEEETIPALPHTLVETLVPSTCAADGQRLVICSECKEVLEEETIPALPHTLVETLVPSTCATTGMRSVICSKCDFVQSSTVIPKSKVHTNCEIVTPGVAPTCTTEGKEAVVKCSDCGQTVSGGESIPALSHSYKTNAVTKAPTTEDNGVRTFYCANCDATMTRSIPKYASPVVTPAPEKVVVEKPKATSISKISAKSKGLTVSWKKVSNIKGYVVQISTDKNFKKNNKSYKITSNKTLSKSVTKLSAKKKYYVRVRTYKVVDGKTYYSAWSGKKSVTTKK